MALYKLYHLLTYLLTNLRVYQKLDWWKSCRSS